MVLAQGGRHFLFVGPAALRPPKSAASQWAYMAVEAARVMVAGGKPVKIWGGTRVWMTPLQQLASDGQTDDLASSFSALLEAPLPPARVPGLGPSLQFLVTPMVPAHFWVAAVTRLEQAGEAELRWPHSVMCRLKRE